MLKFNCLGPRLMLRLNGTKYGKQLKLVGWPFIFRYPHASLRLGDHVTINSNFWSNLLGLYQRTIIVARGKANVSIGDRTGISGASIYAIDNIEIGNDCFIGANTKIIDNDFHPLDADARKVNDVSQIAHAPVHIGNDVFIGMNSIILKGTVIGNNCVIGAGSVVHGQFGDGCIIAGNPAKVIRKAESKDLTTSD